MSPHAPYLQHLLSVYGEWNGSRGCVAGSVPTGVSHVNDLRVAFHSLMRTQESSVSDKVSLISRPPAPFDLAGERSRPVSPFLLPKAATDPLSGPLRIWFSAAR
jgi:hypothetical protein